MYNHKANSAEYLISPHLPHPRRTPTRIQNHFKPCKYTQFIPRSYGAIHATLIRRGLIPHGLTCANGHNSTAKHRGQPAALFSRAAPQRPPVDKGFGTGLNGRCAVARHSQAGSLVHGQHLRTGAVFSMPRIRPLLCMRRGFPPAGHNNLSQTTNKPHNAQPEKCNSYETPAK